MLCAFGVRGGEWMKNGWMRGEERMRKKEGKEQSGSSSSSPEEDKSPQSGFLVGEAVVNKGKLNAREEWTTNRAR